MEKFVNWKTEHITIDGLRKISEMGTDITGFTLMPEDVDATAIEIAKLIGFKTEIVLNAYLLLDRCTPWHNLVALEVIHSLEEEDVSIRTLVTGSSLSRVLRDDAVRDCIWGMIYDALDAEHADVQTQRDA